jgi:hypothetical protein
VKQNVLIGLIAFGLGWWWAPATPEQPKKDLSVTRTVTINVTNTVTVATTNTATVVDWKWKTVYRPDGTVFSKEAETARAESAATTNTVTVQVIQKGEAAATRIVEIDSWRKWWLGGHVGLDYGGGRVAGGSIEYRLWKNLGVEVIANNRVAMVGLRGGF